MRMGVKARKEEEGMSNFSGAVTAHTARKNTQAHTFVRWPYWFAQCRSFAFVFVGDCAAFSKL